jgi:hypothetical protein
VEAVVFRGQCHQETPQEDAQAQVQEVARAQSTQAEQALIES